MIKLTSIEIATNIFTSLIHINAYLRPFTIYKIGFHKLKYCQNGESKSVV